MAELRPFTPPFWLKNPHLQTFWPYIFRFRPRPKYHRERVELPDGDFIDLDWLNQSTRIKPKGNVLLIHGLQGSSQSHYIRGMAKSLSQAGYKVIAINLRGRSGEMNRLSIFGHAAHTSDIDYVVRLIKQADDRLPIKMVAVSLGASMMLNWLAKTKDVDTLIDSAVAISVPYLLASCAKKMEHGFSRIYQYRLISGLKASIKAKSSHMDLPHILPNWTDSKTFYQFDDAVTSRLHGFNDVHDYYQQASTKHKLNQINIPLLLIQSTSDPFMSDDVIPSKSQINNNTKLEVYDYGGHVGFVSARGLKLFYWLDQRIVKYFDHI